MKISSLVLKKVKGITRLKGKNRWSINFTDGSNIVVKPDHEGGYFPFGIVNASGMTVLIINSEDKQGEAIYYFGQTERDGSLVFGEHYEWSERYGFDMHPSGSNLWYSFAGQVVDKREPGKPVMIKVNNNGCVVSHP